MDLRVRPGDQTPEPSVDDSDVAKAEESMTVKVQSQSHVDHIL